VNHLFTASGTAIYPRPSDAFARAMRLVEFIVVPLVEIR
jgi:hypothetical protein